MTSKLYKDHETDFRDYVEGLKQHKVKLSDLRLKQICLKWGIYFSDDLKFFQAEWDASLQKVLQDLFNLRKQITQ